MNKKKELPIPIFLILGFVILILFVAFTIVYTVQKCKSEIYSKKCSPNPLKNYMSYFLIIFGLLLNYIGFSFFMLKDSTQEEYYRNNNLRMGFYYNVFGFFFQLLGVLIQFIQYLN